MSRRFEHGDNAALHAPGQQIGRFEPEVLHEEGRLDEGRELLGHPDPRAALLEWLSGVLTFAATTRGLPEALSRDRTAPPGEPHEYCATARLTETGAPLVSRAAAALTPGVSITDLLNLVTGIALAIEHHPDAAAAAERLLHLTIEGVSPACQDQH